MTNVYQTRNNLLLDLGFINYSEYLKSPLWQSIRNRVLERDGHQCILCCGTATECHHKFYSKRELLGKKIKHIVSLCRICHEKIELDGDRKLPWSAAYGKFKSAIKRRKIRDHRKHKRSRIKSLATPTED